MDYPIINDDPSTQHHAFDAQYSRGYEERDWSQCPQTMFGDPPSQMELIPQSEYDARIDEEEATQSSLEHVYLNAGFENLDQNGQGYCWAYSTGHAIMVGRARDNQPYVRLNPHATAAIIKKGRDEGGWCGLSAEFARANGYADESVWKVHSMDIRQDTAECRANMAKHRVTEDWTDLSKQVYDQNLTFQQVATCLFNKCPCPVDFNWWGHSVCAVRVVRIEKGSYGLLILNSWKDWGRRGLGILQGSKCLPNGSVCLRTSTISG